MQTKILNVNELTFDTIEICLGRIYGVTHNKVKGLQKLQKLDIARAIVIQDNTKKESTFWSRWGLDKPITQVNADVDIYLTDGTCIQVNSSDTKLLKKLMKHVWEINLNPRIKFYKKMKHVELDRNIWNRTQI